MTGTTTKIAAIILAGALIFIAGLGGIALWDPDEPRQAIMAREMMERGDYIHPHLNGKPYLEKPPLYPWLIVLAAKARGGLDEFSARIPAALSAIGLALVTFCLGALLADKLTGLLGGLIFMTNYQVLSVGRESVMDMTFAFFIGLTILCGFAALRKGRPLLFVLSLLPASLAILSKGPAGLVIPAGTLFLVMAVEGKARRFFIPLALGCLLAAAAASVWFLMAGEAYWREFILRQNITRYTAAFDHRESYLYYFYKIFFNFMPWSFLLPFALYHGCRKKAWLPLLWFFFTFLFFFFSLSKRAIYLLPLYPALALLAAAYLRDRGPALLERKAVRCLILLFASILALLPPAFLAAGKALAARSHVVAIVQMHTPFLTLYLVAFGLLGAAFFALILKKRPREALAVFFVYLVLGGYAHHAVYFSAMDKGFKSPRLVTDALADIKAGKEIYTYAFMSPGFVYYVHRPVHYLQKRLEEIKHDKHDILIVVEEHPWSKRMRDEIETTFTPVRRVGYEKEHYVIYQYVENYGR